MSFSIVAAVDQNWGLGKDGTIPWECALDMRFFKFLTMNAPLDPQNPTKKLRNILIMGRKTFVSMESKCLPWNRDTYVVTRSPTAQHHVAGSKQPLWFGSLRDALDAAHQVSNVHAVYVVGGGEIYTQAFDHPNWAHLYLTRIPETQECDTFFLDDARRQLLESFPKQMLDSPTGMQITQYTNKHNSLYPQLSRNVEEQEYLQLVQSLVPRLPSQVTREDRTGVGTFSKFGPQLTFDLSKGFPLLVSKRVSFKAVATELLFFLSGSTNATKLAAQGVNIWNGNTTREFLDARGFQHYKVGDMGPMYGFQWRHAGAHYRGCDVNYDGQGVDQIEQIVHQLQTNPTSRRIILSAHNVSNLNQMVLHPCHSMFQLYVSNGKLSGKLTQRSADIFLGVPFNIASYALLLHMFAHVCNLEVGSLILSFGDVHLYASHVEAIRQMIPDGQCESFVPYPQLVISGKHQSMDDFEIGDFRVLNYFPGPTIRAPMAV